MATSRSKLTESNLLCPLPSEKKVPSRPKNSVFEMAKSKKRTFGMIPAIRSCLTNRIQNSRFEYFFEDKKSEPKLGSDHSRSEALGYKDECC